MWPFQDSCASIMTSRNLVTEARSIFEFCILIFKSPIYFFWWKCKCLNINISESSTNRIEKLASLFDAISLIYKKEQGSKYGSRGNTTFHISVIWLKPTICYILRSPSQIIFKPLQSHISDAINKHFIQSNIVVSIGKFWKIKRHKQGNLHCSMIQLFSPPE